MVGTLIYVMSILESSTICILKWGMLEDVDWSKWGEEHMWFMFLLPWSIHHY